MKTWMLWIVLVFCIGCEAGPTTRVEANFNPYKEDVDIKVVIEVK